jgi:hypothetical protein
LYCFFKDEGKVGLDWKCGSLLNFEVQRRLKGTSTWEVIAQGYWGPGSKTFYDTDVMRDTVYYYKVISYGVFQGEKFYSGFSNPIDVRTPKLNRPTALRVHSPASDRIVVKFRDMSNYETEFEVWRKSPEIGEIWHIETALDPAPGSHSWVVWEDYNVKPESTYFYRARAYTSEEPAGHSGYTSVAGATVIPHLKTSNDSATAFQPKVIYYPDDNLYYMCYSAESLVMASRSDDGLDWEGPITACYWGQELYEKDAGFCQVDFRENALPVMVFSHRNRKTFPPNPLWWSTINFAYFDPDSNDWVDSIKLYTASYHQDAPPPFQPFAFAVIGDSVHLVYIYLDEYNNQIYLHYLRHNHVTNQSSFSSEIAYITETLYDMRGCYPVMDTDDENNLYLAWFSGRYGETNGGGVICYMERLNGAWTQVDSFELPNCGYMDEGIRYLSIKRTNDKTYILSTIAAVNPCPPQKWLNEHSLAYSVKDGGAWQTEWVIADTTASNGQLLSENLVLYALKVNNNWDIYYQEKVGTAWSNPLCVRNTPEKSKFPQGVFDGQNICLIWTEGDEIPYAIDTAKIRVIPDVEIVYPTTEAIPGSRIRTGLPLDIKWSSSDNIGVTLHRVYYSLDAGTTYTKIGDDLSGTTYELNWTVPDTLVTGLMIKVEAYDGANMFDAQAVGPFEITKEFVFNPNFEDVVDNKPYLWTSYGTGDIFETSWEQVQNGQFSCHIGRSEANGYFGFYQEEIPVKPNKTYWLKGYIKTQATNGTVSLGFGIWSSDPDLNHHHDFGRISGNTDWIYVCDSLTTRIYEDTIQIKIFANPQFAGDAWFNNLTLLIDTIPPQVIVSSPIEGAELLAGDTYSVTKFIWGLDNQQIYI